MTSGPVPHTKSAPERDKQRRVPKVLHVLILLCAFVFFAFILSYSRPMQGGDSALELISLASGGGHNDKGKAAAQSGRTKMNGKTIAYAISVTADGPYMDGAAVLAHAIHKASAGSKYGTELIAMVHPNVTTSRKALIRAGWK